MAKKNGASLICRLMTAVAASLCFTTLALPFSQMRLPRRTKFVAEAKIVAASLKQSPRLNVAVNPPSLQTDDFDTRLLSEYGAVQVARNGVVLPPRMMFSSDEEVAQWQASVQTSGGDYVLQAAATEALNASRTEAHAQHLDITPRDTDAAARDYAYTVKLWMSRVDPGLDHWVKKGQLNPAEAERIRSLPSRDQAVAILKLEEQGMFFSQDFSKSILFSVAPPGASQHLALLAFDVKEHQDARVREILERHGWYQTVQRDEPHFTYLGVTRAELPSLGLRRITAGHRHYWIPRPSSEPIQPELVAER